VAERRALLRGIEGRELFLVSHKGIVSMAKTKFQAKRDDKEQSKLFIEKDRSMAQVRGAVYPPPMKGLLPIAVILHENEVIGARAVPSDQDGEAILATMMQEFAGMVGHKARCHKRSN
jgi:hypothetical protein